MHNQGTGHDGRFLAMEFCPNGHERTAENVYVEPSTGRRRCQICRRRRKQVRTPTHESWRAMKARCSNPNHSAWKYYGGRGIVVCERWQSFENFLADMGERPEGRSLDRIDVDGNYEPANCRWATSAEQAENKRAWGTA